MIEETETGSPARVPVRAVLLSIAGIWGVYFVLLTLRAALLEVDWNGDALWRRLIVTVFSMILTVPLWLVLQRMAARPLAARIAVALTLGLLVAVAAGWLNYRIFSTTETNWMMDEGRMRIVRSPSGGMVIDIPDGRRIIKSPLGSIVIEGPDGKRIVKRPGGSAVIESRGSSLAFGMAGGMPAPPLPPAPPSPPHSALKEVSEIALGRYFLVIAWAALFLALSKAEEVRAAERRAAASRRAAKAAELRSLRYQVNPHFLFNTLNSLSALVMSGRPEQAETMIQTLSTFYRTSLTGDPTADVPLDDELRLQQLYLDIEAVRFPERLRTRITATEEARGACVPGMILQPLVENAIKHGVAATRATVMVGIDAVVLGDHLTITVSDDAGGGPAGGSKGAGIGLANVRDRLAARFGDAAMIESGAATEGWLVRLRMPVVCGGC